MSFALVGVTGFICGILACFFSDIKGVDRGNWIKNLKASFIRLSTISTGVVSAAIFLVLFTTRNSAGQFISYGIMSFILVVSSIHDIKSGTVPDVVVIPGMMSAIACSFFNSDLTLLSALIGGFSAGGVFLFLSIITKNGIGMGDAKLFGCAGLFLGAEKVLAAVLISSILCGLAGMILFAVNIKNRKKTMPFAPFILTGAIISVLI